MTWRARALSEMSADFRALCQLGNIACCVRGLVSRFLTFREDATIAARLPAQTATAQASTPQRHRLRFLHRLRVRASPAAPERSNARSEHAAAGALRLGSRALRGVLASRARTPRFCIMAAAYRQARSAMRSPPIATRLRLPKPFSNPAMPRTGSASRV